MATVPVLTQTEPSASTVTDIHTVAASKIDTVRVFVANNGAAATTWRLMLAPLGVADDPSHILVPNENLSSPGSGISPPIVMAATDKLRIFSPSADLKVTVNGISQDA